MRRAFLLGPAGVAGLGPRHEHEFRRPHHRRRARPLRTAHAALRNGARADSRAYAAGTHPLRRRAPAPASAAPMPPAIPTSAPPTTSSPRPWTASTWSAPSRHHRAQSRPPAARRDGRQARRGDLRPRLHPRHAPLPPAHRRRNRDHPGRRGLRAGARRRRADPVPGRAGRWPRARAANCSPSPPCSCWDRSRACWPWATCAWQPAPRFVEAAAALTVAYLAVEILLLPEAGARWLVAGVLGVFHGLYFHLFLQTTGYAPALVLPGAALAELAAIAMLALVLLADRPHGASAPPRAGRGIGAPASSGWSGSSSACGASVSYFRTAPLFRAPGVRDAPGLAPIPPPQPPVVIFEWTIRRQTYGTHQ